MKWKIFVVFLLCVILCDSLFQLGVQANNSSQINISSFGNISAPSPTPSPTPSSPNLEPLSAFYADMNGAASSYASLDNTVLHKGNPSIRVGPDYVRGTREVDGAWLSIKPGDHIVFSAWIKTAPYTSTNPYPGALIGFDFDMSSSCGYGIATIDAEGHQAGHPNDVEIVNDYSSWTGGPVLVPWGSDWTLITWNFYVPTTYFTYVTCGGGDVPTPNDVHPCNPVQINSMVVWFGQRDRTVNAYNWFAEPALYINP